jgi:serine/threonine-protein kinase
LAKVRLLDPTDSKRRLDRYELIGELASGGMATVFLGRIAGVGGFQRFVAIKRLHPHLAQEEEFIEMFLDEARLAAGIHHPHVVPILEVGESESGYYLVMEYIEGDTLARLMARSIAKAKPVPRPVLVRIVLDTLAGLHAAHELTDPDGQPVQLVHRDVSPQNILVGVDGCSRITDFGVAHAASRLQNTRADKLKGKLAYMSPEQARAAEVDRRADVFAMGIILWEVLASKRLFKSENEAQTLQKVLAEPIPRLSQVVAGIHPAFDQVCAKALERDAGRRYRSAAEMSESLERAARTAASTSPTDLGVASPREVAAYVQGALGEDIAAQRESVRAWLAHSEPSMPRVSLSRTGEMLGIRAPDVTMKVPIDRPSRSGVPSAEPSGPRLWTPGENGQPGLSGAPPSSQPPASRTAPSPGNDVPPADPRVALGLDADEEMEPHEGVPDDDDEHETLLMDRDAHAALALGLIPGGPGRPPAPVAAAPPPASARRPFNEEGTPSASLEALAIATPPPRRTPQLVAVVVGLLVAGAVFAAWWQLRADQVPAPALQAGSGAQPPPVPSAVVTAAVVTAPSAVPSAAPTVAEPAPVPVVTAPVAPEAGMPVPPATPKGWGGKPKGKPAPEPPKPAETAKPKPAEPPPKPADLPPVTPKGGDDVNPYR